MDIRQLGSASVTVCAESLLRLSQEAGIARPVRFMAGRTGFSSWRVENRPGEALLMALEAESSLTIAENPWVVRSMRIVTGRTRLCPRVLMRGIETLAHLTVAAEAKLRLILGEAERSDQSVRLVTSCAVSIDQRSMRHQNVDRDFCVTPLAGALVVKTTASAQLPRR